MANHQESPNQAAALFKFNYVVETQSAGLFKEKSPQHAIEGKLVGLNLSSALKGALTGEAFGGVQAGTGVKDKSVDSGIA